MCWKFDERDTRMCKQGGSCLFEKRFEIILIALYECLELCDLLVLNYPETKEWIDHKRNSWILSGLNVHFWQGEPEVFLKYVRDGNIVEGAHHQSQILGC